MNYTVFGFVILTAAFIQPLTTFPLVTPYRRFGLAVYWLALAVTLGMMTPPGWESERLVVVGLIGVAGWDICRSTMVKREVGAHGRYWRRQRQTCAGGDERPAALGAGATSALD